MRTDTLSSWEEWLTVKLSNAQASLAQAKIGGDPFFGVEEWQAHVDFFAASLDTTCKLIAVAEATEDDA